MKIYHFNSRVAADLFDSEIIIANLDTGLYYTLNGTVLQMLKELPFKDSSSVIDSIISLFPNNQAEVKDDLNKIWNELLDEKLIVHDESTKGQKQIEIVAPVEFVPSKLNRYADMQDLLMLDPIHEVDEEGWSIQGEDKLADETSEKE